MDGTPPFAHEKTSTPHLRVVEPDDHAPHGIPQRPKPPSREHGPPQTARRKSLKSLWLAVLIALMFFAVIGFFAFIAHLSSPSESLMSGVIPLISPIVIITYSLTLAAMLSLFGIRLRLPFNIARILRATGVGFREAAKAYEESDTNRNAEQ